MDEIEIRLCALMLCFFKQAKYRRLQKLRSTPSTAEGVVRSCECFKIYSHGASFYAQPLHETRVACIQPSSREPGYKYLQLVGMLLK